MDTRREWAYLTAGIIGFLLMFGALAWFISAHVPHTDSYFLTCEPGTYYIGKIIYHWRCQ